MGRISDGVKRLKRAFAYRRAIAVWITIDGRLVEGGCTLRQAQSKSGETYHEKDNSVKKFTWFMRKESVSADSGRVGQWALAMIPPPNTISSR